MCQYYLKMHKYIAEFLFLALHFTPNFISKVLIRASWAWQPRLDVVLQLLLLDYPRSADNAKCSACPAFVSLFSGGSNCVALTILDTKHIFQGGTAGIRTKERREIKDFMSVFWLECWCKFRKRRTWCYFWNNKVSIRKMCVQKYS